jgi:hypothetical protein
MELQLIPQTNITLGVSHPICKIMPPELYTDRSGNRVSQIPSFINLVSDIHLAFSRTSDSCSTKGFITTNKHNALVVTQIELNYIG